VENLGNAIMDAFNQRWEVLLQHCEDQNPLVKASLINFSGIPKVVINAIFIEVEYSK
jgi:hypothetical protein